MQRKAMLYQPGKPAGKVPLRQGCLSGVVVHDVCRYCRTEQRVRRPRGSTSEQATRGAGLGRELQ